MIFDHQMHEPLRIVPHPRTIRKAREQVKCMVTDGVSLTRIKRYLLRFVFWWATTSELWHYKELLLSYIQSCRDPTLRAPAQEILHAATLSCKSDLTVVRETAA